MSTATLVPQHRKPEGFTADILPSMNPSELTGIAQRSDPYWDQLWAPGSQGVWSTATMLRTRKELGHTVNKRLTPSPDEAIAALSQPTGWNDRLAGWATLDAWRTVTAEQMAAITGCPYYLDTRYAAVASSFGANVLDIGKFSHGLADRSSGSRTLYRPSNTDSFRKSIEPMLTWPEWIHVTGGQPWSSGGQYDRHNVLATELGLRAAEYLPIGTVLGEKFATVDLLAGTGLGRKVDKPDNRRADGVIVREDGLRIAYELTATTSESFAAKVRRWAELIRDRPLETSGLVVLFIAAPHPDRSQTGRNPRGGIYKTIARVLREFPGTDADSPAARIGAIAWEDWFPARHELSESFLNLDADFAVNSTRDAGRWQRRPLMELPFTPWEGFDATAVIENSKLLGHVPWWLREGDHTYLIGTPMDRAGQRIPIPPSVKTGTEKNRPFGRVFGAAGDAMLPRRLRAWWEPTNPR